MSLKRKAPSSDPVTLLQSSTATSSPQIFTSEPVHDRLSIFVAYYSPSVPPKLLQQHEPGQSASHRILAHRLPSLQKTIAGQSIYETGFDDDGEKYGGKTALAVLEKEDVSGSVLVARWYGGTMLGPVRFRHIETVVAEAVGQWKAWVRGQAEDERRVREEGREKERLIGELAERDASIVPLRGLLESKRRTIGGTDADAKIEASQSSPVKAVQYDGMPLARLRMLDKARDKTIAYLLQQIDAVEKELKARPAVADLLDDRKASRTEPLAAGATEKVVENVPKVSQSSTAEAPQNKDKLNLIGPFVEEEDLSGDEEMEKK